jgi:hypothetical protein
VSADSRGWLFCFVSLEELAGFFEVEEVAVYVELVEASVVGDGEDTIDLMAALAQGIDDKLDVYVIHGCQSTGNGLVGCKPKQQYGGVIWVELSMGGGVSRGVTVGGFGRG